MSTLPGILGDIEDAAGTAAALKVARELGGTDVSLSARKGSALVKAVGDDAARKIVAAIGGGRVTIPMAHVRGARARRLAVRRLLDQGKTAAEAARIGDVHERTAWRLKGKAPAKTPFFGED